MVISGVGVAGSRRRAAVGVKRREKVKAAWIPLITRVIQSM